MYSSILKSGNRIPTVVLQSDGGGGAGGVLAGLFLLMLIGGFVLLFLIPAAGMWKAFQKADQPGYAAFIPFLNLFYLIEIADREPWWIVMPFIPVIGWLLLISLFVDVAKQFGKGPGTGVGLYILPFIFWPLIGFGDAEYHGDTTPGRN